MQTLGVIGGSGLYELSGLTRVREVRLKTPYGAPSDAFVTGELSGVRLAFVPRHGRGHRLLPHEINVRANLWGLRELGATRVLSVSAVGSLLERIEPGHLVLPDQFIDLTRTRATTFFGGGIAGHVALADPICAQLGGHLARVVSPLGPHHRGGSYVCIEGPAFSTRAESQIYRGWGASVIGMTAMPEAKLAREAGLCYALLALATDYDCWHPDHASVTVEQVVATMQANVEKARTAIRSLAEALVDQERTCACGQSLEHAVMTAPEAISPEARRRLGTWLPARLAAPARKGRARPKAGASARKT